MAATWIFRGDESRRRRGCNADTPWRRVTRGHSVETGARLRYGESSDDDDVDRFDGSYAAVASARLAEPGEVRVAAAPAVEKPKSARDAEAPCLAALRSGCVLPIGSVALGPPTRRTVRLCEGRLRWSKPIGRAGAGGALLLADVEAVAVERAKRTRVRVTRRGGDHVFVDAASGPAAKALAKGLDALARDARNGALAGDPTDPSLDFI